MNISAYRPVSGSSFLELSAKLSSPKNGLINIKVHSKIITKEDKKLVNDPDYD